ncbi:hypothetical protein FPV67DRAFT_1775514 [Lyophyllum atratum]|nr:hypothetical protein FPV67DRAFT_1775514 [Lyophyllum atratum]
MSSASSPTLDGSSLSQPSQQVRSLLPPTLREILTAYRAKGDGDRDMLLAMLNAKTAEDQRISSLASLQRTLLEVYQGSALAEYFPSSAAATHEWQLVLTRRRASPSHLIYVIRSPGVNIINHITIVCPSSSRSPHVHHHANLPSMRDVQIYQHEHLPRKRHRSSLSPPSPRGYEIRPHSQHGSQHEHLPPSPYSSSGRSDSAEYSPRSRVSMAIGSLLSSGPSQEAKSEEP